MLILVSFCTTRPTACAADACYCSFREQRKLISGNFTNLRTLDPAALAHAPESCDTLIELSLSLQGSLGLCFAQMLWLY